MQISKFQQVFQAAKPGSIIRIKGYQSQDGSVKDHVVEILQPYSGYRDLIRASRDALVLSEHTFVTPDQKAAYAKLRASYTRTLENQGATPRDSGLRPATGYPCLMVDDNKPGTYILLNLRTVVPPFVTREAEAKTAKRASTRDPVNVEADAIVKTLPIAQFIGRMNLVPSAIDDVELVRA